MRKSIKGAIGLILAMAVSNLSGTPAPAAEVSIINPKEMLAGKVEVRLPHSYYTDEDNEPLSQEELSKTNTENATYILNSDDSVSMIITEEAAAAAKAEWEEALVEYWDSLFDENSDYYEPMFIEGTANNDYSSFIIIVDKEEYDNREFASVYLSLTSDNLALYSRFYQAYSLMPVEEQTAKILFMTEDGELLYKYPEEQETEADAEDAAAGVEETSEEIEETPETTMYEEADDNCQSIDLDYVALDDENVTVKFTSVSSKVLNPGYENEYIEYRVNYSVTNKSDEYTVKVYSNNGNLYVGPYSVMFATDGASALPGKINDTFGFITIVYTKPGRSSDSWSGTEHIEKLEDLLQFSGKIEIEQYTYDGEVNTIHNRYEVDVALPQINTDTAETVQNSETESVSASEEGRPGDFSQLVADGYSVDIPVWVLTGTKDDDGDENQWYMDASVDSGGRVISYRDGAKLVEISYDEQGRDTGSDSSRTYDENGLLTERKWETEDDDGKHEYTLTYEYDENGLETRISGVVDNDPATAYGTEYSYVYNDDGSVASRTEFDISDGVKKQEFIFAEDYDSAGHVIRETQASYRDNRLSTLYVSDYTYDLLGHIVSDDTRQLYDADGDDLSHRMRTWNFNICGYRTYTADADQELLLQPSSWEPLEGMEQLPSPESVINGLEKAETLEENGVICQRFILPQEDTGKADGYAAFLNRFDENTSTAHDKADLCYLLYQAVLSQALGIELTEDYTYGTVISLDGKQAALIKPVCEKELGMCLDILIPTTEEAAGKLFAQDGDILTFDTWEDSSALDLAEPDIDAYAAMALPDENVETGVSAAVYTDAGTAEKVQQALNDHGFDCGPADGVVGQKTTDAIIAYQTANGLEADGVISDALLASLGIG